MVCTGGQTVTAGVAVVMVVVAGWQLLRVLGVFAGHCGDVVVKWWWMREVFVRVGDGAVVVLQLTAELTDGVGGEA